MCDKRCSTGKSCTKVQNFLIYRRVFQRRSCESETFQAWLSINAKSDKKDALRRYHRFAESQHRYAQKKERAKGRLVVFLTGMANHAQGQQKPFKSIKRGCQIQSGVLSLCLQCFLIRNKFKKILGLNF